ncbi:hypothetical protein JSO62_10155 [Riemerella anatipestifer]|uniref:hypothetical protein n=1 Tax=Riemerella anatipestifer TaxID=34085 RepID=UPI0021D5D901|nr:hypothetical protein [Riemerella anatipestifer]MCU7569504.1 hypothetical protein [Riemerella anatipestifer]
MERILISQREDASTNELLVYNGLLITDKNEVLKHAKKVIYNDDFKQVYKDDFVKVKVKDNRLYLSSYYTNKDNVGRRIHYTYLIDAKDNLDVVLSYLEKDSEVLDRQIEKDKIRNIIEQIKTNEILKNRLSKLFLGMSIVLGVVVLYYFFKKIH